MTTGWVAFSVLAALLIGLSFGALLAAWALCEFNVDISRAKPPRASAIMAALQALINTSYEAHCLIGPKAKPEAEYDEYDTMMAPLWKAAQTALEPKP